MHDMFAISNSLGHPDTFITMTCNLHWPEIQNVILASQRTDNRPDLCDLVFDLKIKILLKHLKQDESFGKLTAVVSVIEFQKLELVHAHIITFLDDTTTFSLQDPTNMDNLISAEIPPVTSPHLRELV